MAEDKARTEAPETNQAASTVEYNDAARQKAPELTSPSTDLSNGDADDGRAKNARTQALESVDFYIAQGYADIAHDTLDLLERQFGSHPEIDQRRRQLETGKSDNASQAEHNDEARPAGKDFGQLLDQFEQEQSSLQEGEVVRATVLGITEKGVVIDFGYTSEGIVNQNEFMEDGVITVKPGDEVDVLVKNMETGEGFPLLSRADAVRLRAWDDLEKAFNENTPVKGRVAERIKGGLRVDIDGIAAFLPGSQVDVRPVRNLDSLRGREIEAKVIKLNRKRSNVVLSRKAVLEERNKGRKEETLGQIEEDTIVEGQIKNLTDYGAFVDLGGVDGLLHMTDMSWGRLQNPAELFRVGDTVQVKVLRFDRARERVSLGYKQLLPDPWETIEERLPPSAGEAGRVDSVTANPMPDEFVRITISRREFDRLGSKTAEILKEAALAQVRIAKDREEIELFKTETREILKRLRAV